MTAFILSLALAAPPPQAPPLPVQYASRCCPPQAPERLAVSPVRGEDHFCPAGRCYVCSPTGHVCRAIKSDDGRYTLCQCGCFSAWDKDGNRCKWSPAKEVIQPITSVTYTAPSPAPLAPPPAWGPPAFMPGPAFGGGFRSFGGGGRRGGC